jgi:hypothetical protein
VIIPIPYVLIGLGAVMIAVSVPLAVRMVPANRWYGVRTRKAFASEDNWYELNAYGGKLLAVYGGFLVLVGVVGLGVAPDPTSLWSPVLLVLPLLPVVVVLLAIRARGRKLPG